MYTHVHITTSTNVHTRVHIIRDFHLSLSRCFHSAEGVQLFARVAGVLARPDHHHHHVGAVHLHLVDQVELLVDR